MLTKAAKQAHKNGFSTKKGTNQDIKATCGIEGPPSKAEGRIVGGPSIPQVALMSWLVPFLVENPFLCACLAALVSITICSSQVISLPLALTRACLGWYLLRSRP